MTKLRDIVITDKTTGDPAAVNTDNQLSVEAEITDKNGLSVELTPTGNLPVESINNGHICTDNSTQTPLINGGVFDGDWQDTLNYNTITIGVSTDQDSANDGLDIQWSSEGTIIDDHDYFSLFANNGKVFTFSPARRYFKVVYTNGGTTQTVFDIQSIFKKGGFKDSSHRINDAIVGEDDAALRKSVITGLAPDGTFKNVQVTNSGNQKISIEEFESAVSDNGKTQLKITPYGSSGTEYKQDATTGAFTTIGYEHHEIHGGSHYFICDFSLNESSGAVIEFVLTTDNSAKWMHSTLDFSGSEGATLEVYKNPTGVVGGTAITPINNNGNSTNTSLSTVVKDPASIAADGTRAAGFIAGGGKTSGFNSRDKEIILKQNTVYLFRITSLAVSNDIGWCFEWYEHTNI